MNYSYEDYIKKINIGEISAIYFMISDYKHYCNCSIKRIIDVLPNKKTVTRIEVRLTNDETEKISFLYCFNEDYKLFNFGKQGRFTLKQIWDKVKILNID